MTKAANSVRISAATQIDPTPHSDVGEFCDGFDNDFDGVVDERAGGGLCELGLVRVVAERELEHAATDSARGVALGEGELERAIGDVMTGVNDRARPKLRAGLRHLVKRAAKEKVTKSFGPLT